MEELKSAINWFEIPAIGYFAIFDDTEGNRIYLHSMS